MKMSLEEKESEIQGWWCLDSQITQKYPRIIYNVEEHLNL